MTNFKCFKNKILLFSVLVPLLLLFSQVGLWAQSAGGGLLYTSYLPFGSLYNALATKNHITNAEGSVTSFKFDSQDIIHYAPGVGITGGYALKGILMSVDIGVMGGPGPDNIIPDFPVRPFIAFSAAAKFVNTPVLGFYGIGSIYLDLAVGEGKNSRSYTFTHFLAFLRVGPGLSLKFTPILEFFAQVQIGIGVQLERIYQESKAGNAIYEANYVMIPVALFPEAGIRLWF